MRFYIVFSTNRVCLYVRKRI